MHGRNISYYSIQSDSEGLMKCTPCIHLCPADLRTLFLIECLDDLKKKLMQRGLNLLIQQGKPEEVIPLLVKTYGANTVKELLT